MFKRKECKNCGNKIGKKDNFCSKCGANMLETNKMEGLNLQENTNLKGKNKEPKLPMTGFGGKMMNNLLGNAIKMLENEMQKEMKDMEKKKANNPNFKLKINGKEVNFDQPGQKENIAKLKKEKPKKSKEFSSEQAKRFSQLKKETPSTNLKRLGNKVIYEIEMPEVKSDKDIAIHNLENSIEIKAIGKDKAYSKAIPIKLPITNKKLSEGKLILEMEENTQ